MARRKSNKRKRSRSRPRLSKKRRMSRKSKNLLNMNTYSYKFSADLNIIMSNDAQSSAAFALPINYPYLTYDGKQYTRWPTVPPVYTRCENMYREYRVRGFSIKLTPRYTQHDPNDSLGTGQCFSIFDPQLLNVPGSLNEAANYPNAQSFLSIKPWKRYFKNTFTKGWFRTGALPTDAIVAGTQTPQNPLGGLGLFIAGLKQGSTAMFMRVTYYLTYRSIDTTQQSEQIVDDESELDGTGFAATGYGPFTGIGSFGDGT